MTVQVRGEEPPESLRNGAKQRAQIVLTKAPAWGKNSPSNKPLQSSQAARGVKPGRKIEPVYVGSVAQRLIEEEKRAVRRHRKQLARIVVDQWRHFARKAILALNFQKRVLERRKQRCWDAWQGAVLKRRQKWTMQARAVARRRLTLEHQVWRWWVAHVQAQRRYQEAAARLLWMDARRTYSAAFAALKAHRDRSILKRQTTAVALSHWRTATLSHFLTHWRSATKDGQLKLAQRVEALQSWAAWRKRRVFVVWRRVSQTLQEHRLVSERLSANQARRVKAGFLARWRTALEERRVENARLDRAYAFQYLSVMRRAVGRWALFVAKRKERKLEKERLLARAARHAECQLARRGFESWRLFIERRRGKGEAMHRAEAADVARLKRLSLRAWTRFCQAKEEARAKVASAHALADGQLQARALRAFGLNVQRKHRREQVIILAGRHWVRRMKRASFARWRTAAAAARAEREATEEMLEEKKMVIVRAWQREFFLSRALYGWQQIVSAQRDSRQRNRTAAQFLRAKLLRKSLEGFVSHAANRKRKARLMRTAHEAYQKELLRRVLCGYWPEALSRSAAKREACRNAAALRSRRLQRVSFEVWRVRTAKWALKSAEVRRAALHREEFLLRRCFEAWRNWVSARRAKRQAEDERVKGLRDELGLLTAGRVLAAWIEQHDRRLVRKLKSARARGHFREVRERQGLRVWGAWLAERKRKQKAWQRAERLWERLLERRAIGAWREYVEKRRGKKCEYARALRQWSRRLQRVAFQAWISYSAERRAKAVSMTSADRLYQSHLIHKAASRWLKKTRRRQQLRLQIALEKQALTSIAQLARVAPYARKWRHLARMRREEREGGRHGALLDGWAVRNIRTGWRNPSKTRPFGGHFGGDRIGLSRAAVRSIADVSMASALRTEEKVVSENRRRVVGETINEVSSEGSKPSVPTKGGPFDRVASAPQGRRAASPVNLNRSKVAVSPPAERSVGSRTDVPGRSGSGPVLSVVERITASIASGASVLDALPPWARAQSRPPPRRPAHLLTAGKSGLTGGSPSLAPQDVGGGLEPPFNRRQMQEPHARQPQSKGRQAGLSGNPFFEPETVEAREGSGLRSSRAVGAPEKAESLAGIGSGGVGLGGSLVSAHPGAAVSPAFQQQARSQAMRAESVVLETGQERGNFSDSQEGFRTAALSPPEDAKMKAGSGGVSAQWVYGKAAVKRQLVLGDPGQALTVAEGYLTAEDRGLVDHAFGGIAERILHTAGARGARNRAVEDLRPGVPQSEELQTGTIVPVGRLDPRTVAQEVTWMEQVLREFDDLKAQSAECVASLTLLQKPTGVGPQVAESITESDCSGEQKHEIAFRGWSRAERIWELEQRHAALELRKKLQLPMVKAVAERIKSMAVGS